jgi:hypothetical protein
VSGEEADGPPGEILSGGRNLGIRGGTRYRGGWSAEASASAGGFIGAGPEGLTLPPGTVIRAIEGGFRIEGPRYWEDQAARTRIKRAGAA